MRVTLESAGGQVAAINLATPPRVVDTESLPEDLRREFEHLLAVAISAQESSKESSPQAHRVAADAMTYRVTVDRGDRRATYVADDLDLTDEFAALINWFTEHAVN